MRSPVQSVPPKKKPWDNPNYRRAQLERRERRLKALKEAVFAIIGRVCQLCGDDSTPTVDHIDGRPWRFRNRSYEGRWKTYLIEAKEGMVRCLCLSCNGRDGRYRQLAARAAEVEEEAPF